MCKVTNFGRFVQLLNLLLHGLDFLTDSLVTILFLGGVDDRKADLYIICLFFVGSYLFKRLGKLKVKTSTKELKVESADGEWTYDKMYEMADVVDSDTDGDGNADTEIRYSDDK